MKDVRVEFKFKNAILYNALQERFKSASAAISRRGLGCLVLASKVLEVEYQALLNLVNLKASPRIKGKAWRPIVLKISAALDSSPDVLFPDALYGEPVPSNCFTEIHSSDIASLTSRIANRIADGGNMDADLDECKRNEMLRSAMKSLKPREAQVLSMRFGLDTGVEATTAEIADHFAVSGSRVQQIEATALRRLRNPYYSKPLRQFAHVSSGSIPPRST